MVYYKGRKRMIGPARKPKSKKAKKKGRKGRANGTFQLLRKFSKAMNGSRRYLKETRQAAIETTQNEVTFAVVSEIADRAEIETMIKQVGSNYTGLGETASIGAYESNEGQYKVDITNYKKTVHLRNVDLHPAEVTIYEIVSKKSRGIDDGLNQSPGTQMIWDIQRGFKKDLVSGTATATQATGSTIVSGVTNTSLTTYSKMWGPGNSQEFRENWKILRKKLFRLSPGDDIYWDFRAKNRVFNPKRWYNIDTSAEDLPDDVATHDMHAYYTKVLLVKIVGAIGRSDVTAEADVIGFLQTDIAYDVVHYANLCPLLLGPGDKHAEVGYDDLTAKILEGPVEHEMKEDDD